MFTQMSFNFNQAFYGFRVIHCNKECVLDLGSNFSFRFLHVNVILKAFLFLEFWSRLQRSPQDVS